ncbi:MAG: glutamine-hydrolyzing GMP synthase subunit GuaA, partial [Thermoproteota archaeon]
TIDHRVRQVKLTVGGERALCAVSGGVDSTTAALIARRAIGDNLRCILIDHGLMRKGERESILKSLSSLLGGIKVVEAQSRFLGRLKGVADPEEKRRVIGEEYAKVLQEAADEEGCSFLIQGTIYPDRVESGRGQASEASRIKTHHNVGGLPSWLKLKVVEPLADLYKDEVRKIAAKIGVPSEIIWRHPFPGPGLAVRVIGEVTPEKLHVCREASHIVEEELKKAKLYRKVWQAFAVVGDDKATGVKGDKRALGYIVTVRVVTSVDGMTADWAKLPHSLLDRISSRITGEIQQVTWVTYAITTKPPATIEPV